VYGENAPPSWARLPGARCRAVEHLTKLEGLKEFELLEALLNNAGRVLTRDTLIDRVWGPAYVGDTKTLDVHIKRLRSKVEADPSSPVSIVTIRGLGYKFEPPARTPAGA